jgi:hypothetical protein
MHEKAQEYGSGTNFHRDVTVESTEGVDRILDAGI